jgi:chromosome partitioning protein
MTDKDFGFQVADIAFLLDEKQQKIWKYLDRHKDIYKPKKENDGKHKRYSFEVTQSVLKELYSKDFTIQDKIQLFFNFKGGTGKTSLCFQVSTLCALFGFKVLVIDCDPQGHLSTVLGFNTNDDYGTLYDLLETKSDPEETLSHIVKCDVIPGLDVMPSNISMTRLELMISGLQIQREFILKKKLSSLRNKYDFIFIDANPTISITNVNAILASDATNIICETQPFSLKALEILKNEISYYEEQYERTIKQRIICNKYEGTVTSNEAMGAIFGNEQYKSITMATLVKKSEDFNISAKKRQPLFQFARRRSNAYIDSLALTKELIQKSSLRKPEKEVIDHAA